MKIRICRTKSGLTDDLRRHTERRLRFALTRFGRAVGAARAWIGARTAEPAGDWSGCRVEVHPRPTGRLAVAVADAELYVAADWAAERVGRALSRELSGGN